MSALETTSITSVVNFAARFCNELDGTKNFICSPLSVETVLALTALGSGEGSRAEIFKVLYIPNEENLRSSFKFLTSTLDLESPTDLQTTQCDGQKRNPILKTANKIYLKQGDALKLDLQKDAVDIFKSSLEQIDFTQKSTAADSINNWVATQTNNIIKQVVSADMFDERTGLVLVNAIYFHGFWKFPFASNDTRTRVFHVNSNKEVNVRMMGKEGAYFNFKHNQELKAKILQMFYEGDQASMVIVLPDEIEGLSCVMQQITDGYDLIAEIKSLEKTRLKVAIPKFKVETEIDLKELLPKMGIKTIFDEQTSDIKMLSSNEPLYVSEAVQKAFIAVDEKGTEAAAATVIPIERPCCIRIWKGEEFTADHPFLFLLMIRDIPIFYGVVCRPSRKRKRTAT